MERMYEWDAKEGGRNLKALPMSSIGSRGRGKLYIHGNFLMISRKDNSDQFVQAMHIVICALLLLLTKEMVRNEGRDSKY